MNDRERREFEMALTALLFLKEYQAEYFQNIPAVAAAIAVLQAETDRLRDLGADKVSTTGEAKDKTIFKGDLRDALRDAMQDVADMWRPMAKNYENAQNKFRMPNGSDQLMIDTAGSFIEDATPLLEDFKGRGMPANFITDLTTKRDAFDAVVNESEAARLTRIGVNAQFREPLRKCRAAVDDVDPIVKMVFRDDPAKRAEWLTASHVQRASKRTKPPTT
jgi:hypothetical protein